jgi:hypothetical protein
MQLKATKHSPICVLLLLCSIWLSGSLDVTGAQEASRCI